MKGSAIDLTARSVIFIAIITIVALASMGFFSFQAFQDTCRQDTISQISKMAEKMSSPGIGGFTDELRVGDCVEYIDEFGVQFKNQDQKKEFYNFLGDRIVFELDDEKILPREEPYNVIVIPPMTISMIDVPVIGEDSENLVEETG